MAVGTLFSREVCFSCNTFLAIVFPIITKNCQLQGTSRRMVVLFFGILAHSHPFRTGFQ